MNIKFLAVILTAAVMATGCSNSAECEASLKEHQQALTDTVAYFTDTVASMQSAMAEMEAELTALRPVERTTSSAGTTSAPKTDKPAPRPIKQKIDVAERGKTEAGKTLDEIKEDAENATFDAQEKINVKTRGKSSDGGE